MLGHAIKKPTLREGRIAPPSGVFFLSWSVQRPGDYLEAGLIAEEEQAFHEAHTAFLRFQRIVEAGQGIERIALLFAEGKLLFDLDGISFSDQ